MSIFDSQVKTSLFITAIGLVLIFLVTANWGVVSASIFPNTILGLYSRGFWENYLVELHGMALELAVVGGLIIWLDSRRVGRSETKRQLEDLSDYAQLDTPEVNLKKTGIIKRLNDAGVKSFNVQNLALNGMLLNKVEMRGGKLIGLKVSQGIIKGSVFEDVMMRSSNFEGCDLKNTSFARSNLLKSKFSGAICRGVSFEDAILERSDFSDCDMQGACLRGADLRGVKFDGANLKQCSLKDAKNIDIEMLAKAACLDYIAISDVELDALIKIRGSIKYQKRGRP